MRGACAVADKPKFGVFAPQGWRMDLVHIKDPAAQYEAMSRVAQEAERLGFDSVWLYDHFHTVPSPRSTPPSSAGCPRPLSPGTPRRFASDRWSAATATATPPTWPRLPPRSTP